MNVFFIKAISDIFQSFFFFFFPLFMNREVMKTVLKFSYSMMLYKKKKRKKKEFYFQYMYLTKMYFKRFKFQTFGLMFFFLYRFVLFCIFLSIHCSSRNSSRKTSQEANTNPCRCCIPVLLEHHTLILTCDNSGKTSYWNVILQYYLFRSYIRQFDGKVSATRTGCIEQTTRATSKIKSWCSYTSRFEI